jgi:hypothetical protein
MSLFDPASFSTRAFLAASFVREGSVVREVRTLRPYAFATFALSALSLRLSDDPEEGGGGVVTPPTPRAPRRRRPKSIR